jgi:serine phosphatase RsbU (regulator of sigma subunit)
VIDGVVIERLLERLCRDADAEVAFIGEVGAAHVDILWSSGLPDDTQTTVSIAATPCSQVIARRGPVVIDDADQEPLWAAVHDDAAPHLSWTSFAGFPLPRRDGDPSLVLALVARDAHAWDDAVLATATDLALVVADAIEADAHLHHLTGVVARERDARVARAELQRLAAAAAAATTVDEVATAITARTSHLLGARVASLAIQDPQGVRFVHGDQVHGDQVHGDQVHGDEVPDEIRAAWPPAPDTTPTPLVAAMDASSTWIELADPAAIAAWPLFAHDARRAGVEAFVAIPLRTPGRSEPVAALGIGWDRPTALDDAVRGLLAELVELAGDAIDRAQRHEHSADVAETLQRSLLPPRVPTATGLQFRVLYRPGTVSARVGGDWYDIVATPDGGYAVVVGDVAGHDLRSAAEMGQMRHVIASQLALHGDPGVALESADRYFHGLREASYATVVSVVLAPDRSTFRVVSAGHVPPLALRTTGVRPIDVVPGPPVGTGLGSYTARSGALGVGESILLYTDGLIERRDRNLDESISELASRLASAGVTEPADVLRVVRDQLDEPWRDDDAAVLVVRRTE